jgi:hypothetical protein
MDVLMDEDRSCWMKPMMKSSANISCDLQVLAVDILNPTPAAEARKHKLKVGFAFHLLSSLLSRHHRHHHIKSKSKPKC